MWTKLANGTHLGFRDPQMVMGMVQPFLPLREPNPSTGPGRTVSWGDPWEDFSLGKAWPPECGIWEQQDWSQWPWQERSSPKMFLPSGIGGLCSPQNKSISLLPSSQLCWVCGGVWTVSPGTPQAGSPHPTLQVEPEFWAEMNSGLSANPFWAATLKSLSLKHLTSPGWPWCSPVLDIQQAWTGTALLGVGDFEIVWNTFFNFAWFENKKHLGHCKLDWNDCWKRQDVGPFSPFSKY